MKIDAGQVFLPRHIIFNEFVFSFQPLFRTAVPKGSASSPTLNQNSTATVRVILQGFSMSPTQGPTQTNIANQPVQPTTHRQINKPVQPTTQPIPETDSWLHHSPQLTHEPNIHTQLTSIAQPHAHPPATLCPMSPLSSSSSPTNNHHHEPTCSTVPPPTSNDFLQWQQCHPTVSVHPMVTRSGDGTRKPKIFAATLHPLSAALTAVISQV